MISIRSLVLVLVTFAVPGLAGLERAWAEHGIHDQAGLFSSTAVRQADQAINRIYGQFHKDVLVETFAAVPAASKTQYEQDREAFFNTFLQQRARQGRVDGVYMLLMKEPPPHNLRVQIGAGHSTRQQLFPRADQDEVVRVAKSDLRSHEYDRALLNTVAAIDNAFRRNAGSAVGVGSAPRNVAIGHDRAESSGGISFKSVLFWGGLIVIALMILSALFRRSSGPVGGRGWTGGSVGPSGPYGSGLPGSGMAPRGGGFFSSLFGGIAGGMAGNWLYDRFFGERHSPGGFGSGSDSFGQNVGPSSGSDVGSDFTSSGADIDDNSRLMPEADDSSTGGDLGGGFDDSSSGDFDSGSSGGDV